jgi:hypothetical protein
MSAKPLDAGRHFLIRLTIGQRARVDPDEVRRTVEYLGGIAVGDAFAFPSERRRAEALALLRKRFGYKYFDLNETIPDGK